MGNIIIQKVKYSGDDYFYESPTLGKGVHILEGPNGSGKSTFSYLIYYCLSGTVLEFKPDNKNTHQEIINDRNNYIELHIDFSGKSYILQRRINSNDILIIYNNGDVSVLPIFRTKNEKYTFSDWILENLEIDVVELYQGAENYKINFKDIFRLIYHDQAADPSKIYKSPDVDNYITESEALRKVIFQLLLGKTFSEYYKTLSKLKELEKRKNISKTILDQHENISISLNLNKENLNVLHLSDNITENKRRLEKLINYRKSLQKNEPSSPLVFQEIENLKSRLLTEELKLAELQKEEKNVLDELVKYKRLKEDQILEVTQIKKIIYSHEELNLFTPDTCPYCLREVKREPGYCVCGASVDESEYEKFFYDTDEYTGLLKSKQKSVETIETAIKSCNSEYEELKIKIHEIKNSLDDKRLRIKDQINSIQSVADINSLNEVDDKILEVKENISLLNQQLENERKRANLQSDFDKLRDEHEKLKISLKKFEALANEEIHTKIVLFNEKYNLLMQAALQECRSARIDIEDYMPIINDREYREKSSLVPIRLMYYFSLFYLSLKHKDVKFPRFLLIDTPETLGIDPVNFNNSLSQLNELLKDNDTDYQIILTTGVNKYPSVFKEDVFQKLSKMYKLLLSKKV